MIQRAAHLGLVLILALSVRASWAQYPPGQGQPPPAYGPQPQAQQQPQQPAGQPNQQAAYNLPPQQPQAEIFKPAEILARVGDQFIFFGDVAPTVDMMLEPALQKARQEIEKKAAEQQLGPAEVQEQLATARREILKQGRQIYLPQVLQQYIQNKMMYMSFERDLRKNTKDKYGEARASIDKKLRLLFEEQLKKMREVVATIPPEDNAKLAKVSQQSPIATRLAVLMRDHKLESMGELETKLRSLGTSLEQQISQFGEQAAGRQAASSHFKNTHEVTHQELQDYYEQHADDFRIAAKVKFEILTVKWANFPDRDAARSALATMGNHVFYGASFAEVARRGSQEPNAKDGGLYDWVTKGSLASKPIDQAIFSLDVERLSQIIEDDTGCHIVRVKERTEAGMISFVDAQTKIKEAIEQQKKEAEYKKFVELLQKSTVVWTIFDAPATAEGAGPQRR